MASIGTPFTQTIPAVGAVGTQYATDIDAFLTEVQTRLEAKVPFSSILGTGGALNANNQGIGNVNYLALYPLGAAPTALSTALLSLSTYNGDLYWVTTGGVLQVTTGTTLNAAGIGGIGGDYGGSNPARENFVDATSTYEFYDDFAGVIWAKIKASELLLVSASAPTFSAVLAFNGPATVTYTLPSAAPGSGNSILSMDSTGAITASATITNDFVLGGATKIQHGTRSKAIGPMNTRAQAGGGVTVSELFAVTTVNNTVLSIPIDSLHDKQRLTSVVVRHGKTTTGTTTITVVRTDNGVPTTLGTATSTTSGSQSTTVTFTSTVDLSVDPVSFHLQMTTPATTGDKFYAMKVNYDQQA